MAHTHPGNAGDFLKHTILAGVTAEVSSAFTRVRYIDPYCGEGLFWARNVFRPPVGHPKLAVWRAAQPALDEWYFGSPVVAARGLAGCRASLHVSDCDPDAVRFTETVLTSPDFWSREIPGVTPPRAAEVRAEVAEFDPRRLVFADVPDANILLLDPTYRAGYPEALRGSIQLCRKSGAAIILLAWGMRSWGLTGVFESEGLTHWTAPFANGGATYEMVMASFGESRLDKIASEAASGW